MLRETIYLLCALLATTECFDSVKPSPRHFGGSGWGWYEPPRGWYEPPRGWYEPPRGSGWGAPSQGWGSPYPAPAPSSAPPSNGGINADTRTLDQLYRAALAEGGKVIVYAGGDTAGQLNMIKDAFEKRFPNVTVELIVDFSKNHDARIDNQLATNTLIPDVTHLQTIQDFSRWKKQGVLMQYKPVGWNAVYPEFKDPEGFWTAILCDAFSNVINQQLLSNKESWPTEARDFLRPEFNSKLVSTYPNDDDAVLFWYKQIVDKYGWDWLQQFVANNPIWVRGTQYPADMVANGSSVAALSVDGTIKQSPTDTVQFVLPKADPFVSWAQPAAIFKNAKRPNAAKLYMSWWLDFQTQRDVWYMWSVRKDVPVPAGFKSLFDYPGQTDPLAFGKFMEDRAAVERFKAQVTLYVGEVKGDSPPGNLGLHPDKMSPAAFV